MDLDLLPYDAQNEAGWLLEWETEEKQQQAQALVTIHLESELIE